MGWRAERPILLRFALAPLLVCLLPVSTSQAQVQRSFVNLGFEQPGPASAGSNLNCFYLIPDSQVPGWNTSHPSGAAYPATGGCGVTSINRQGRPIEMWRSGFQSVIAREGYQFAELNAYVPSRLSQNVCVVNGEEVNWRFSHRGRGSATVADVMEFLVGSAKIVRVATESDGGGTGVVTNYLAGQTPPATAGSVAASNGWRDYSGTFIYQGESGIQNIGFEAISAASGASVGNFLDAIQVQPNPYIEFRPGSVQASESVLTPTTPAITVTGNVLTAFNVTVNITSSAATLGTDYTTPSGTTTFSVPVPAGNYDGSAGIPLGINIIDDSVIEGAEVIQFTIGQNSSVYTIASTVSCGSPAISSSTYTILDNDSASLAVTKDGVLRDNNNNGVAEVGETVRYTFVVTNTGTVPLTNITIADTLAGVTVSGGPIALTQGNSNSIAFTALYALRQSDIDAGQVVNAATASGRTVANATVTSPPSSRIISIQRAPSFTVTKTVDKASLTAAGPLNYTIRIANTGNVSLTGIVPTDTLPDGTVVTLSGHTGDGGTAGTLDVGETWTYAAPFTVGQVQFDAGANLVNTVSIDTDQTDVLRTATATTTIARSPSVRLSKTAGAIVDTTGNGHSPGDTIPYSFSVTNTGNVTLNPIALNDPLLGGAVACPVGPLAPGATLSCGAARSYTLTQADIDAGSVTNSGTISATAPGGAVVTNTAAVTTPITRNPEVLITKMVDQVSINAPATLNYEIKVQNRGNVSLSGVVVADTLPNGNAGTLVGPTGDAGVANVIDVGETWTYTISHAVTQAVIDSTAATLTNTATVRTTQIPALASARAVTTIDRTPSFTVVKTVNPTTAIAAPGPLTYTITLTNTGNVSLTDIVAVDTLNGAAQVLPAPSESVPGGTAGVLDLGEVWSYTLVHNVTQAEIEANTSLVNSVSVTSAQTPTPQVSSVTTPVTQTRSMSVNKTVDRASISTPGSLAYTVTVTNRGNVGLSGVVATDTLPDGAVVTLSNPTGDTDGDSVLDVGEVWTYQQSFAVTQAMIDAGGSLLNAVSVAANGVTNPVAGEATTRIVENPAVAVTKVASATTLSAPGTVNYTITVRNGGNQALASIAPADTGPDGAPIALVGPTGDAGSDQILSLGEVWTYTASYAVSQAELDAGAARINTVAVTATNQGGTQVSDTASARTNLLGNPSLSVTKTLVSGPNPATAAGQVLNYQIVVRNTGNVNQTGVALTDTVASGAGSTVLTTAGPTESGAADGILALNETWTYTASYTVAQADIDDGREIANSASATSSQVATPVVDRVSTPIRQSASFETDKVANLATIADPGPINYMITLTNTGNVSLSAVAPVDTLPNGAVAVLGAPSESLPGGTAGVLDVGEVWTYQTVYNVTNADIANGATLINTIRVTTAETPSPQDTAATSIAQLFSMSIDKEVDKLTLRNPDTLTYTIHLRNTGNVPLSNVVLTDTLDGVQLPATINGVAVPAPVLTGGDANGDSKLDLDETWEYQLTYAVDQNRINLGTRIVNRVEATATSLPLPIDDDAVTVISQSPGLLVDKDVDRDTILRPGTLNYTIRVTNTGNVDLADVDPLDTPHTGTPFTLTNPTGDNAPVGVLNPGETWLYTATYAVSQAQLELGNPIVNRVDVSATEPGGGVVGDDSVVTTPAKAPSILLTKSANLSVLTAPGTLNYTVTLANTGNISLNNVVVQDTLPDGTAGTLSAPTESGVANNVLDVDETWTYTISYVVDQARFNQGGIVTNTVTAVTNLTPAPQTATADTELAHNPGLSVDKTVDPAAISAPATLNYAITVRNIGNVPLTGVVLTDTMPDGAAGTPSGPVESGAAGGGTAGVLDIGEVWTYTASFVTDQADIDAGTNLTNTASVLAKAPDNSDVTGTDSATTAVEQNFSLHVEKDVDLLAVHDAGELLSYTITVTNTGNGTLRNVVISDTLPNGQPAVLVGPGGDDGDMALELGEIWTYTTTYVVTQADLDGEGVIENTVTVGATGATPVTDVADTVATDDPGMLVEKDVDLDSVSAPGPLNYTIAVHNTGNQTLDSVVATDHMPGGTGDVVLTAPVESGATGTNTPGLLDVGETWTYAAVYTVTQADIDAGLRLTNTVDVAANDGNAANIPHPVTGSGEAFTEIVQDPALTVTKTVDRSSIDAPTLLNYLIKVQNTGKVTLTGVQLTDDLVGSIAQTPARGDLDADLNLDVGETWEFDATLSVTQAQIDAGTALVNTASVTATAAGRQVSGSGSATTVFNQAPALVVEKTVLPLSVSRPGQLTYTITARNSGNVSLTGPSITDTVSGGAVLTPVLISGDADNDNAIDVGETWTYQVTHSVDQAAIDAGVDIVNTVSVDSDLPGFNPVTDNATTTVTREPGLSLNKVADKEQISGAEAIGYTITAVNTGNVSLVGADLTIVDTLPDGTLGILIGPTTDIGTADAIDVGETWTYTISHTPTQAQVDAGATLRNTVSLASPQLPAGPVTASADTSIAGSSAIAVAKTATFIVDSDTPGVADAGDQIEYSVTVTNTGTLTVDNLALTDSLNGRPTRPLACPTASLAPAASMTCTAYSYLVTQADVDAGGSLANTATASGTDPTGTPLTPARATQTTPLADVAPAVVLNKMASAINDVDGNGPDAGDQIVYTFSVQNTGNMTLTAIGLDDPMLGAAATCPGPAGQPSTPLEPGRTAQCGVPVTYVLTVADFARGNVTNEATVVATPTLGPDAQGRAQVSTQLVQVPALEVVKYVDQELITAPGPLNYTIFLTNTGNVALTNLVVTDTLPDGSVGTLTGPFGDADGNRAIDVDEVWTYTVTYQATQADFERPPANGTTPPLINNVAVTADQLPGQLRGTATTQVTPVPILLVDKTVDKSQVSVPTRLTYKIKLTNAGSQPLSRIRAMDTLPDGRVVELTNPEGDLDNDGVLDAGEVWTYTSFYDVTQADIDGGRDLVSPVSVTAAEIPAAIVTTVVTVPSGSADIVLTKQAGLRQLRMGETVPFTIRLLNEGPNDRGLVTVTDIVPGGFRFVDGSALLNGVAVTPELGDRSVTFENVALPANSTVTIELRLLALSTAVPGRYVNRAQATDAAGNLLAPEATASVEIIAEPVFDCAELIGRVFDDRDRDGYMDDGEPGLPGVRIATVYGQLITTDEFGRYSVPCADMPNADIGSNFVLKVDTRTLPTGYSLTTPNPEGVRLTAGKMSKVNFGASEGRGVAIELTGAAFASGAADPSEPLREGVSQLIVALQSEPSLLRITYRLTDESAELVRARIERLRDLINAAWRDSGAPYHLEIQILTGDAR